MNKTMKYNGEKGTGRGGQCNIQLEKEEEKIDERGKSEH